MKRWDWGAFGLGCAVGWAAFFVFWSYTSPPSSKPAADGALKAPVALTQEEIGILQGEIIPKFKKDKVTKAAWEKKWKAELEGMRGKLRKNGKPVPLAEATPYPVLPGVKR